MGGLPHRARDLVRGPVPVRSDGMEAENVGEEHGAGSGEQSMTVWRAIGRFQMAIMGLSVLLCAPSSLRAQDTTAGKKVYVKWCAGCHGETGAGDGPAAAYMLPRPRNFTGAIYKIRTTASGQLPTDADMMRAIDEGLPGSAMPAWKGRLSDADRRAVLAYLKTFSSFFADTSQHVVELKFGSAPGGGSGAEALKVGRQFYDSIGCRKCHGDQGRGDGPSAPTLKDDAGFPIFAADLHQSWRFRGGASVEDVYRRLRTGLDGTPMPSFADLIDQKFLTDEQLWRLAQYVRSLSPARTPEVRDVIHAPRVGGGGGGGGGAGGTMPPAPDDAAWVRGVAGRGRGRDRCGTLAGAVGAPGARSSYDHGECRVVFTRSLATPDTANELQFEPGRAIPVAFFAWDGSSGEHGTRLAVSTWYFLALDQPTPPRVFISPVVAMALTLGLGVMVVLRAQRRGTAGSRG